MNPIEVPDERAQGADERCPACGEHNGSTAAECISCGRSLAFLVDTRSRSGSTTGGAVKDLSRGSFWSSSGAPPVEEGLDYAPGETFADRYVIIDRLGQGGMGVVYKARDLELNRVVALKMIRAALTDNPESLERFRREPGLAQQVTHENVCRVHDLGVFDGVRFLSMEYLEANTLSDLVAKLGRLSVRQTLEIATQVASGLAAIHEQGIVHRDLKPSNIAVDAGRRAVVMDFGLARGPIDSELTEPGVLVGSYAYLSPEHIQGGELTVAVDLYAFGLLLFELLTGHRPPGDGDQRPLALRGADARCPPASELEPDVPRELDALIRKCLAWNADERPNSVDDVLPTLQACRNAERERTKRRAVSSLRLRPRATGVALLVAVLSAYAWLAPAPAQRSHSIQVASFTVEDPADEPLALVATDAMTAGLALAPNVVVAADGGAWTLDGTIGRDGGDVVITASVRNENARMVWQNTVRHPEPLRALETLQSAVLDGAFSVASERSFTSVRTDNLDAYESFLQADALHEGWYATGALDDARALYQRSLELDPEFALAHAGQAMASAGEFMRTKAPGDKAVAQYAAMRAVSYGAALPEAHLAQGTYFASVGKWDEAAEAFGRAFERAPRDERARLNIADLYDTLGRPDEARALYEEAIAIGPDNWANYYGYGQFLFLNGRLDEAPTHLEKAAELNPEASGPVALLGFVALSGGDLGRARHFYQRALELRDDVSARKRLGLVFYYDGAFDRALQHWQRVLALAPDDPSAHTNVADALRQQGHLGEARDLYLSGLALYDDAIARNPGDDDARALRALTYAALGQCSDARIELGDVLRRHEADPHFLRYAAVGAGRCQQIDWATDLVLESISAGNVVDVRYDPDLAVVRDDPRVRRPLSLLGAL